MLAMRPLGIILVIIMSIADAAHAAPQHYFNYSLSMADDAHAASQNLLYLLLLC